MSVYFYYQFRTWCKRSREKFYKKNIDDCSWENEACAATIFQKKKKKKSQFVAALVRFFKQMLVRYSVYNNTYTLYIYINHWVVLFDACRVGSARLCIILNTSSSCAARTVHLAAIAERIRPPHAVATVLNTDFRVVFLWRSKYTTI